MNLITIEEFKKSITNITPQNVNKYYVPIMEQSEAYCVNTKLRLAHFLAQVGHETLSFVYYREIASGKAYEGRKDLGNIQAGDGEKFRGRGLIQITGRDNYKKASVAIFGDTRLLEQPELLELPEWGTKSAFWFWQSHKLNSLADKDDIKTITKRINGGLNGFLDRNDRLKRAKKVFGI